MTTSRKTIAKNAGVMMASQLITWALAFLVAIFLPRYLGAMAVGQLSISFSIWLILNVLIGFGMDTYLTKSIARAPERAGDLVGTSIMLRSILFVAGFTLAVLYLFALRYSIEIFYLSTIIGISMFFTLIGGAMSSALLGLERMEYASLATTVSKTIDTALTLTLLFLGFDVYWIASVFILNSAINLSIIFFFMRRHFRVRLRLDMGEAWSMLRLSSPYLVTGLTLVVYQQIDKLFISTMVTTEAVGWFGTAMSLFGTLMFVPVVVGTVLFPSLSRNYASGIEQLAPIARRSFDMMFMMSVPVGLGLIIVAKPLVLLVLGPEFAPTGDIVELLGLVLIITYLNTMLGQMLISADRTGKWNVVMIVATCLTLPLDLLLVPWTQRMYGNGALGGAISFAITELLMFGSAILLLPKGTLHWSNVRTVLLTLLAGLAMLGTTWWLRESYMLLAIVVGAATYGALVPLLRIISPEEMALLKEGLARVVERLRGNRRTSAGLSSD